MPKGAALSEGSSGENISHFTALRFSIRGTGNLKLAVYAMNDARSETIVELPIETMPERQPTRLLNFITQRASFEGKTTEQDEYFRINRIIVYMKELWTSYPG